MNNTENKTPLNLQLFAENLNTQTTASPGLSAEMKTYYENSNSAPLQEFINERRTKYKKEFIYVADFSQVNEDIIYFCFLDKQQRIESIYSLLKKIYGVKIEKYRDIYSEDLWYAEVFGRAASKYNGAQFLRRHDAYDTLIGFGDNLNDIPLFEACDQAYAVSNAKDEVKSAATAIIESNIEDGVVKWIQKNGQSV